MIWRVARRAFDDGLASRTIERQPRNAEQQFQLLVASVKDYAIFMLDPAGHVTTWNAGARQIKGYLADEVIGKHMSIFYTPRGRRAGQTARRCSMPALAEGRVEDEGWRVRKDGSRFWADVVITALRDPEGTLQGFVKVTRDLTARREAEEKLRQSEESLAATLYSIGDAVLAADENAARHAHQPGRGAPDRMVGEGSDRPPDRRGLQHRQRGDARQGPEPRQSGAGGGRGRRPRQSHRAHLPRWHRAAHRRQRCANPRRARGDARRGAGLPGRHRRSTRRGGAAPERREPVGDALQHRRCGARHRRAWPGHATSIRSRSD